MNFTKNLSYGSIGLEVLKLQNTLEALGYADFIPTMFFGFKTEKAVKAFQRDYGIDQVGEFGPITRAKMEAITNDRSEWLYAVAMGCLNTDASWHNLAPKEYACAETVTTVLQKAGVNIPIVLSTIELHQYLSSPLFTPIFDSPKRGDVLISTTGTGNGNVPNGHVGILGEGGLVMSNNSYTGLFDTHLNLTSWKARYIDLGGYKMEYFRLR